MCFSPFFNIIPKWLLTLHRHVLGVTKIMILLKGVCVRKSVFKDVYLKVTDTGVYFLFLRDKMCYEIVHTQPISVPVYKQRVTVMIWLRWFCSCAMYTSVYVVRERDCWLTCTSKYSASKSWVHSHCLKYKLGKMPILSSSQPCTVDGVCWLSYSLSIDTAASTKSLLYPHLPYYHRVVTWCWGVSIDVTAHYWGRKIKTL